MFESPVPVTQETIGAMLPKLGKLVSSAIESSLETIRSFFYLNLCRMHMNQSTLQCLPFVIIFSVSADP
jgi:hypothetical protein